MTAHDATGPAERQRGGGLRKPNPVRSIPNHREVSHRLSICILFLILACTVTAAAEPPVADFLANQSSGIVPFVVEFTDTSTGIPEEWSWDFGDGSSATDQHPIHTFTTAGTYTVSLTVTNNEGSSMVAKPAFITTQEPRPALIWGPYLTLTSATGTTINLKTDIPSRVTVDYATDAHYLAYGDYELSATDGLNTDLHHVALTGLSPGTRYHYRVTVNGEAAGPFTFRTFPLSGPFSFVVYSDTQDQLPTFSQLERHRLVADRIAAEEEILFVINCGDLVNNAANLSDWDRYFAAGAAMMANTTVYPALGNHEANHTNYYEIYGVPQWYSFDCAGAHFSILDTNSGFRDRMPEQSAWLADDLAGASGSQWRFAAFHHPPYSSERNHFGGWEDVRAEWEDEFIAYEVTAVFSGHVHSYERFLAQDIHYLVLATGGGPSYNLVSPRAPFSMNSLEYALAYARVTIDPVAGTAVADIIRVADISPDLRDVAFVYPPETVFETVILGLPDPPVAGFTANATSGPAPLTVRFFDNSTGDGIGSWAWDVENDGIIDFAEQHPVHTYTAAGRYTVNMTVTNAAGSSTEVKKDYITVTTPGGTVLSVNPPTSSVLRGKSTTIQVVLGPLPQGLSGYNISLDLSDPTIADIIGLDFPGWAPLNSASTLPADQLVFSAVDLETVVGPGAGVTVLADITIRGEAPGTTGIILGIDRITAHGGDPIIPEIISGSLSVHLVEPFPGYMERPTDPDSDGLYEDTNGNGVLDFDDVVTYFQNLAWVTANTAVGIEPYDFNGNGRIDYDDVVVLYHELLSGD